MVDIHSFVMIGLYALLVLAMLGAMLAMGSWLGERVPQWDKDQPYECGIPPTGDARLPAPVRYYVVAVSFLVFDIETAFLFAWAAAYWELGVPGVVGAVIFILILLLGLVYEWRKGGLAWSPHQRSRLR